MTRAVLITGASTGFGALAALSLARRGWQVLASMRDLAKADPLLAQAHEAEAGAGAGAAGTLTPIRLDVTDAASVAAGVAQALDLTGGRLDALLNNAGYSVMAPFEELTDADIRAQMETNFFGTLAVTRAVLPVMRTARAGRVLTVTSNAVNAPHPLLSIYAASKWALEGWAEGLAMEMAPFGVEVGVVEPGAHRTPFASNVQFRPPSHPDYAAWFEAVGPGIADLDAWGRDPALAAAAIVDLLEASALPFRTFVGEDTQIFAALKGAAPYDLRAALLRLIVGAPAPGAYRPGGADDDRRALPVLSQVLDRLAARLGSTPGALSALAAAFRF